MSLSSRRDDPKLAAASLCSRVRGVQNKIAVFSDRFALNPTLLGKAAEHAPAYFSVAIVVMRLKRL